MKRNADIGLFTNPSFLNCLHTIKTVSNPKWGQPRHFFANRKGTYPIPVVGLIH
jgi:hypothetical protein